MSTAEKTLKKFMNDYIFHEENIFYAERLFVANSVLRWALENSKDERTKKQYIDQIERHLLGEITLYWDSGVIKIKKV